MHNKETDFEGKINSLKRSDFKPLLNLIPEIQATSWFGKLKGGNKNKDGSICMPYYEENKVVSLFRSIAYNIPIIIPFDWGKWEKGRKIVNNPYFDCQTIDIITICKTITAIVRSDRFCEGALISAFESGLILKLLVSIKNQLKWLKEKIKVSKICHTIHQCFDRMKKHSFHQLFNAMKKNSLPRWFNEQGIPKNGIYILFEKGEFAHTTNRIVRIGTHTGNNKLRSRLKEHLKENKDRSIFRKNIGRALLNKDNDSFIEQWNKKNLAKKIKKTLDFNSDEFIKQEEIEKRVTEYIQENISFVTFQIDNKKKRLELESKIISTVSRCDECNPSQNWFGLFSPKAKIIESGLWLVNKLWKTPLSESDLIELKNISENAGQST